MIRSSIHVSRIFRTAPRTVTGTATEGLDCPEQRSATGTVPTARKVLRRSQRAQKLTRRRSDLRRGEDYPHHPRLQPHAHSNGAAAAAEVIQWQEQAIELCTVQTQIQARPGTLQKRTVKLAKA